MRAGSVDDDIEPELGLLGSLGGARPLGVDVLDLGGTTGTEPLADIDEGVREGRAGGSMVGLGGARSLEGGDADTDDAAALDGTGGGGGLR